jgi:hypothetical protein
LTRHHEIGGSASECSGPPSSGDNVLTPPLTRSGLRWPMPVSPLLTVVYTGQPDEVFEFRAEGHGMLFGRDDDRCDIVIWSAINGTKLSRVAGRIWRMEGELWVRNLSTSHELALEAPGEAPMNPLPPCRDDLFDPGPACSVRAQVAFVRGPDGCELLIRQRTLPRADVPVEAATERVAPIPRPLRRVAVALCEPLLSGGQLPAAYNEIARRIDVTYRQARNLVGELTEVYESAVPRLRERTEKRRQLDEAALELPQTPVLRAGVWNFDVTGDSGELARQRRRALAMPDYYDVALLLVRRGLVTHNDLDML